MKEAEKRRAELQAQGKRGISEIVRRDTRPFEKGFLILYPIADAGLLTKDNTHKTPFGFAVVFPDRKGIGKLKTYRANEISIEKDNDELYI